MAHLLGIDLGTSRVKVLLVDEYGEIRGKGDQGYPLITPQPGWVEQDPEQWWAATVTAVRQALVSIEDKGSIAAIGLSGQMHGTVLMDERNHHLYPAVIWPDQRSSMQVGEISQLIGSQQLVETTGSPLATGFQAATMRWFQQEKNEIWRQVHKVLLPKDYLRWRLTGVMASDPSDGAGTLLVDGQARDWSAEILEKLEIDARLLPQIQSSLSRAGGLVRDAGRVVGLPDGIPVITGAADTACSLLGAGIISARELLLTISTGGQLVIPAYEFNVDRFGRMHTFCSALEPSSQQAGWYLMSATLSAGLSLRWLRDNVLKLDGDYEELSSWAEKAKIGSDGLLFWPYLMGERSPLMGPKARGMFVGLSSRHGKAELVRSVMEGVIFSLYDALQVMVAAGIHPERIILAGGGARSRLWRKITADVFGLPVAKLRVEEQSALGAALIAGAGIGLFDIVNTSQQWVKYEAMVDSDLSDHAKYDEVLNLYRSIYQNLKSYPASQSTA